MAAEETFKRSITRSSSQAHITIENEIGEDNYKVYLTEIEANEPKTFKQQSQAKSQFNRKSQ